MNKTPDGASSRPEGASPEGSPSWTPKEPNRPLRPKPHSFGPSQTFPHAEGDLSIPEEPHGPTP